MVVALVACGGGSESSDDPGAAGSGPATGPTKDYVAIDAEKFCQTLAGCTSTTSSEVADCVKTYEAVRVAPECKTKIDALACDSIASMSADCFPTCEVAELSKCDGPHITTCRVSALGTMRYTLECGGVCASQGATWSGTCSDHYGSQQAITEKCWCY